MNENYEDYEDVKDIDENEEYEEDNKEEQDKIKKRILLIVLIIIGIIIIILLLRRCGRGNETGEFDYEKTLLQAGKEYYEYNENEIPKSKSSCTTVSLSKLVADGLLNPDKYEDCDGDKTYVKVCLLSNGKVHYVPILKCDSIDSDNLYADWKEGKLDDIKPDETDVKFAYLGQALKKDSNVTYGDVQELWYGEENIKYSNYKTLEKTTYYRYRDQVFRWLSEIRLYYPNNSTTPNGAFYIASPADGYTNKDNEQLGYKWYKLLAGGTKEYCEGYHYQAPSGCPNADKTDGYVISSQSRTFTKTADVSTYSAKKIYMCVEESYKPRLDAGDTKDIVFSHEYNPCGSSNNAEPTHNYEYRTYYACQAGGTEVAQGTMCYACTKDNLRPDNSACGIYGEWKYSGEKCTGLSDVCVNLKNPIYYYKWYKESGIRSYYPSGSTTASGEKNYYISSPGSEYIQDDATKAKVWNWYNKTTSITEEYYATAPSSGATRSDQSKWLDWSDWNTVPVQSLGNAGVRNIQTRVRMKIQEIKNVKDSSYENIMKDYTEDVNVLIKAFKDKGYEVNTLEDIALNGELKYLVKLYVRNK